MRTVARTFSTSDLVGGHPALDLVNTVTARNTDEPIDWLDGFDRLVEWAALAGVVDDSQTAELRRRAAAAPPRARAALQRARELREALHRAFGALIARTAVPPAALRHIDVARQAATARTRLEIVAGRVAPALSVARSELDFIADTVVLAAVALLAQLPSERARLCPGSHCGWLFLDSSKGGQRVWCDMATCGNAAKARRHLRKAAKSR